MIEVTEAKKWEECLSCGREFEELAGSKLKSISVRQSADVNGLKISLCTGCVASLHEKAIGE